jgi:hypothetical protein
MRSPSRILERAGDEYARLVSKEKVVFQVGAEVTVRLTCDCGDNIAAKAAASSPCPVIRYIYDNVRGEDGMHVQGEERNHSSEMINSQHHSLLSLFGHYSSESGSPSPHYHLEPRPRDSPPWFLCRLRFP